MTDFITDNLIEEFKNYLTDREMSFATLDKYIRDIRAFSRWTSGERTDRKKILAYKEYLINNFAPASVNSVLSSLNSFFQFIGRYDLKVRMLRIQRQIFARKEKELTKAEYGRLLDAAKSKNDTRLFLLMQTICSSGIRVSELRFVTLEAIKNGKVTVSCKGKMRMVFLPSDLCRILLTYAKSKKITSGPIFVTKTGRPLDRSTVWKMMKALCKTANVSECKVFPHNLRHLFARTFYEVRRDIVRLADVLGHSNVNTTRIYTMETGDIHRRQIQKLGLLRL